MYKGSVDPPENDTTEICVKRNGGTNEGTEIRVTISPPLATPCPRLIDWTGKDDFIFRPGDTLWRKDVNGYWTHTYVYQGPGDSLGHRFDITDQSTSTATILSFKPRTTNYNLAECGTFCLKIYNCSPKSDRTVKIETRPLPDDSTSCDQDSLIALKPVPDTDVNLTGLQFESQQNYPNPFGAKTQFKTTIPFEIPSGGEVLITVFASDGKEITTETMAFETSGKHFFFFTGERLPPGSYFYRIEFPKGNVIVSKQMLLVK